MLWIRSLILFLFRLHFHQLHRANDDAFPVLLPGHVYQDFSEVLLNLRVDFELVYQKRTSLLKREVKNQ